MFPALKPSLPQRVRGIVFISFSQVNNLEDFLFSVFFKKGPKISRDAHNRVAIN